jgi:hypothetical protein
MPNTYANPSVTPPIAEPDSTDNVMTPANTGAQQLDATPEKTPREKKLALSPRVVSGARRIAGSDHMRPVKESTANAIMSTPPAKYTCWWY